MTAEGLPQQPAAEGPSVRILLLVLDNLGHQRSLAGERLADEGLGLDQSDTPADGLEQMDFELQRIAGNDLVLELRAVNLHEIGRVVLRVGNAAQHHDAAALGHRLDNQHAWHDGLLGEVSHEEGLVHRDVLDAGHRRAVAVEDAVDEQEGGTVGQACGGCR